MQEIIKVLRFSLLYGLGRTIVKIASRSNNPSLRFLLRSNFSFSKKKSISLIGCGQFGFSTISYFLLQRKGKIFLDCYDLLSGRSELVAKFYGYHLEKDVNVLLTNPKCKLIYIASNHASHSDYAIKALENKKDVYIEKPLVVDNFQWLKLQEAISKSHNKVFVGYNRPFSKAMKLVSSFIENSKQPISLSCFISGHIINADHWYRNEGEGTRICGNLSHWIDLMVFVMSKRGFIPTELEISILSADNQQRDDNLSLSIRSNYNDIINIMMTSRCEPFEGINETINLQCGEIIAKIDDFRKIDIWNNENKISEKYFTKDVGHQRAILQPFLDDTELRKWQEIEITTMLMLKVKEMVLSNIQYRKIYIK